MHSSKLIKIILDFLVWFIAGVSAYLLKYDGFDFAFLVTHSSFYILTGLLKLALIVLFGLYNYSWRFANIFDIWRPAAALLTYILIVSITDLITPSESRVIAFSMLIIESILAMVGWSLSRVLAKFILLRIVFKNRVNALKNIYQQDILIVGAGEVGAAIVHDIRFNALKNLNIVGFLDDDPQKQKQYILGKRVLGRTDQLEDIIKSHNINKIIIAHPEAPGSFIKKIVTQAQKWNIDYAIIPKMGEIVSGKISYKMIRNVKVEDLLSREPIHLDTNTIKSYISDKVILVTGAGGSIGSELVRQIIKFKPTDIILLGRGENSIFELYQTIKSQILDINLHICICDIRNKIQLEKIFKTHKPEIVFHAAAHKHVFMMEQNPAEAVQNNIMGTKNLVDLSLKYHVNHFINISSDKAVNPTSVMGATKRITEMLVQFGAENAQPDQYFVSVRFGNVLGSRGSVLNIFRKQLEMGGPITVTHPEVQRYFMTIPEASQLVLQAGAILKNGALYILEMGEPVKIIDMAKDLIRLYGLVPDKDIEIVITGLLEGEKILEELVNDDEETIKTDYKKINTIQLCRLPQNLMSKVDILISKSEILDSDAIKNEIFILANNVKNDIKGEAV